MIPPSTPARGAPARLPLMGEPRFHNTGPTVVHGETAECAAKTALSILTYLGTAEGKAFAGDQCIHALQEKMVKLAGDAAERMLPNLPSSFHLGERILREIDGQWRIDDRTSAELDELAGPGGYYYEHHLPSRVAGGLYFQCTCSACPEQYDVWRIDDSRRDQNTHWGHVRIRNGYLKVEAPLLNDDGIIDDAVVVYLRYDDDHLFDTIGGELKDEETRVRTLEACAEAIHEWWRTRTITDETTLSLLVDGYTSNRAHYRKEEARLRAAKEAPPPSSTEDPQR